MHNNLEADVIELNKYAMKFVVLHLDQNRRLLV